LNVNYFDALNDPSLDESLDLQIDRFVTAHAILFAMKGVPGIYFHSLIGSRGWAEGAQVSGHNRTINREKLHWDELIATVSDPTRRQARALFRLSHLLKIRRRHAAFDPHGSQQVFFIAPEIFAVLRSARDGNDRVLCLHNVSERSVLLEDLSTSNIHENSRNLINGKALDRRKVFIEPFETLWLA
jgi:sucrose phosphorylase